MVYLCNPNHYPDHSFPLEVRYAIHAIHAQTKAPLEIVGASVLAVLATATQHVARVRRPSGQVSPLSLALLTFAASGDRKTSSDEAAFVAIRSFEKEKAEQHRQALQRFEVDELAWKARRDGITRQIKQRAGKGAPVDALHTQLAELQNKKPARPRITQMIYADTTPEALAVGLHSKSQSAALVSNEASRLLFGPAMSNLSMLSELWSGSSVPIDRVSTDSFVLEALLTSALMVQPGEFERYQKTKGAHIRGSGYLARCLVARAESIQGWRELPLTEVIRVDDAERFHQRIGELLATEASNNAIEFDMAARELWRNFFNRTEVDQRPYRYLADISDFASKIADNAARIAAIFSVYCGKQIIDEEAMHFAIGLSSWYLEQFKKIFGAHAQIPEEQRDGHLLRQWAYKHCPTGDGFIYIEKSRILQRGPNPLRNVQRLNPALHHLQSLGLAFLTKYDRKVVVRFTPWGLSI